MADRVPASMTIGGKVTADQFAELAKHIADYDLRIEWGGAVFDPARLPESGVLELFSDEANWGMFSTLETWLQMNHIPYRRWSGSCPGSFEAERVIYDGNLPPRRFSVDEDDHIVLYAETIENLGSMRAIRRHIKSSHFVVPPFMIVD